MNNTYNYFEYSAARYGRLRELNKVLNNDDIVSLKQPCSTRWLSLNKAVKGIYQNWAALCIQLEEDAVNGNATASGLQKDVTRYSFIAMTCFLQDVLLIMDRLSLTFQQDDVILSTIKPMIESTSTELYSLIDNIGNTEREFREILGNQGNYMGQVPTYIDEAAHTNVREGFLRSLISTLDSRFPGMAKQEMPESKFQFLMELQEQNGVPALQGGKFYKHHTTVSDLQKINC